MKKNIFGHLCVFPQDAFVEVSTETDLETGYLECIIELQHVGFGKKSLRWGTSFELKFSKAVEDNVDAQESEKERLRGLLRSCDEAIDQFVAGCYQKGNVTLPQMRAKVREIYAGLPKGEVELVFEEIDN